MNVVILTEQETSDILSKHLIRYLTMSRKFNKQKSLEEGEVVLDEVQPEQEPANVPMETAISTEPTAKELQLARELTGTPSNSFDSSAEKLLVSLCRKGVAAYFGTNCGFARGHKWHQYF